MISAFGAGARRYAAGLGPLNAVIADAAEVPRAFIEGVARRERGEAYYAMVLADDRRVEFAYGVSDGLTAQVTDVDLRRRVFAQLADGTLRVNERTASDYFAETSPMQLATAEFYILANAMLVRSYTEFAPLAAALGHTPRPVERVLIDVALPPVTRVMPDRPSVVVWAPQRPPAQLALHLFGLSEFLGDVTCIAGDGPPLSVFRPAILGPADPRVADVLARATVIVCVEPNDPSDAVAFARRGYGVVAPLTAGAHEFAPEIVVWDAANAARLHNTVSVALGRPAAVRAAYAPAPPVPEPPPPPMPRAALPLVSIVIPTYNRPADLRRVLAAVEAQTYPALETIVVNDAGTPVEDVVADFPFVRLINHDVNGGAIRAVETGTNNASGEYIALLPDDDWMYPDHVERVMYALLRAGAKVAHGNGLLRYVERLPDDSWKTTGFNGRLLTETLTQTLALLATPVSENGVIQHRSVFAEAGWFLADSALNDLEFHMRLGRRYVFVHSDHVTFEFREHAKNHAKSLDFATELKRLYTDVHPVPGRPLLEAEREATYQAMAARVPGRPAFPPTFVIS
jgi:hypothetical protein